MCVRCWWWRHRHPQLQPSRWDMLSAHKPKPQLRGGRRGLQPSCRAPGPGQWRGGGVAAMEACTAFAEALSTHDGQSSLEQTFSDRLAGPLLKASEADLEDAFERRLRQERPDLTAAMNAGNRRRKHWLIIPAIVEELRKCETAAIAAKDKRSSGDALAAVAEHMERVGRTHRTHGVPMDALPAAGAAMHGALCEVLGERWQHSEEGRDWRRAFDAVTAMMRGGYRDDAEAAAAVAAQQQRLVQLQARPQPPLQQEQSVRRNSASQKLWAAAPPVSNSRRDDAEAAAEAAAQQLEVPQPQPPLQREQSVRRNSASQKLWAAAPPVPANKPPAAPAAGARPPGAARQSSARLFPSRTSTQRQSAPVSTVERDGGDDASRQARLRLQRAAAAAVAQSRGGAGAGDHGSNAGDGDDGTRSGGAVLTFAGAASLLAASARRSAGGAWDDDDDDVGVTYNRRQSLRHRGSARASRPIDDGDDAPQVSNRSPAARNRSSPGVDPTTGLRTPTAAGIISALNPLARASPARGVAKSGGDAGVSENGGGRGVKHLFGGGGGGGGIRTASKETGQRLLSAALRPGKVVGAGVAALGAHLIGGASFSHSVSGTVGDGGEGESGAVATAGGALDGGESDHGEEYDEFDLSEAAMDGAEDGDDASGDGSSCPARGQLARTNTQKSMRALFGGNAKRRGAVGGEGGGSGDMMMGSSTLSPHNTASASSDATHRNSVGAGGSNVHAPTHRVSLRARRDDSAEGCSDGLEGPLSWQEEVVESFEIIKNKIVEPGEVGAAFHRHLVATHPEIVPLFQGADMIALHSQLMASITLCVDGLYDPESLRPTLIELGRRHVAYGALDCHLEQVGDALLAALAEVSGPEDWTPARREGWTRALTAVVDTMAEGLRSVHVPGRGPGDGGGGGGKSGSVADAWSNVRDSIRHELRDATPRPPRKQLGRGLTAAPSATIGTWGSGDDDGMLATPASCVFAAATGHDDGDTATGLISQRRRDDRAASGCPHHALKHWAARAARVPAACVHAWPAFCVAVARTAAALPLAFYAVTIAVCLIVHTHNEAVSAAMPAVVTAAVGEDGTGGGASDGGEAPHFTFGSIIGALISHIDDMALALSLVAWLRESDDRARARVFELWGVVDGAAGTARSRPRISALEQLNTLGEALDGVELRGAVLEGIDMRGADLRGAALRGAEAQTSRFDGANLCRADMRNIDMCAANLSGANLGFANLEGARLASADLSGALLTCTSFVNANMSGCNLCGARVSSAIFKNTYLVGANLVGTGLTVELLSANGCTVTGAKFTEGQVFSYVH